MRSMAKHRARKATLTSRSIMWWCHGAVTLGSEARVLKGDDDNARSFAIAISAKRLSLLKGGGNALSLRQMSGACALIGNAHGRSLRVMRSSPARTCREGRRRRGHYEYTSVRGVLNISGSSMLHVAFRGTSPLSASAPERATCGPRSPQELRF